MTKKTERKRFTEAVIKNSVPEQNPDFQSWRSIFGEYTVRDIPPQVYIRALREVSRQYDLSPNAKRIIEYYKNYIIGEGIYVECEDPEVDKVVSRYWNDPINNWKKWQDDKIKDLFLFGEAYWTASVNEKDGFVRMGYIDPLNVTKINRNKSNSIIIDSIEVIVNPELNSTKTLKVINVDLDPQSKTYGMRVGEVFVFMINKPVMANRGRSELIPIIDWIIFYDEMLKDRFYKINETEKFIWDVTLEGATKADIKAYIQELKPIESGVVRVHNEKVKWNLIESKAPKTDISNDVKLFKNHILIGAGFPPHWFSDGEGARAVAYEMGYPTEKTLVAKQKVVKCMFEEVINFVIDQAIIHGQLKPNINRNFSVILPEISIRDTQRIAEAVDKITNAMITAKSEGWITDDDARKVMKSLIAQLGIEVRKKTGGGD